MRVRIALDLRVAAGGLLIAAALVGCAPPGGSRAGDKVVLNTDGSAAVTSSNVTINATNGTVGVDAGNGVTLNTNGTVSFHL